MKKTILFTAFLAIAITLSTSLSAQTRINSVSDTTLEINRKKIDSLDRKLMEILGERERVVRTIGVYKAKHNIAPLQAARFQQVLEKGIQSGQKEGLSAEFITEMLNAIHGESLRIEGSLRSKQ